MRDVGAGERHVARLGGLAVEDGRHAQHFLEHVHHLRQRGGVCAAQIERVVRERHVARRQDARDDVVDPGVVAPGGAVAEEGERLTGEHAAGELVDGQVGALARAVDGEEAQGGHFDFVQVVEGARDDFGGDLARGIGTFGRVDARRLLEGRLRVRSVHRRAAAQDESSRPGFLRGVEQDNRAARVHVQVIRRPFERRPHAGQSGQVHHDVWPDFGEDALHRRPVPDVVLEEARAFR